MLLSGRPASGGPVRTRTAEARVGPREVLAAGGPVCVAVDSEGRRLGRQTGALLAGEGTGEEPDFGLDWPNVGCFGPSSADQLGV